MNPKHLFIGLLVIILIYLLYCQYMKQSILMKSFKRGMELTEEAIEPDYLRYKADREPVLYRFEPKVFDM
jgi:hypothetical protein